MTDGGDGPTDRKSLLDAFLHNRGLIGSVIRRYVVHRVDVEDLTQETLVRALEAMERTQIEEPRRFLIGVAKNVARKEIERRTKISLGVIEDLSFETHVSDEPDAEAIVDGRQRLATLTRAVETLPPQCRKVFVLKHVYGASHKEIAAKLDIAVSTVEKHAALALRRCREEMLDALDGEEASGDVIGFERRSS